MRLAETLGKSYVWIQENISGLELDLWHTYWIYKAKKEHKIPTGGRKGIEEQKRQLNQIAKAFGGGLEVKKRPKGT